MDSMNNPLTLEKALELNVQRYAESPAPERERIRAWIKEAAYGHPDKATRDFNTTLYGLVLQVESRIAQAQRPPLPTPAETNAFLLWGFRLLVKAGGGLAVIGGGLYLVGAAVVGTGEAIRIWAVANAGAIGWGIAAILAVIGINALPRWKGEQEEKKPETPAQNQTIINVYSATGGDVTVNNLKTQFNEEVFFQRLS